MSKEKWNLELSEYIKQGELAKKEKAKTWETAIGLQDVDGLKPSKYLLDTAKEHIEGNINLDEAKKRINRYYEQSSERKNETNTEEADKVSVRIAEILSEKAFNFAPTEMLNIHKRLFAGIYDGAGKYRDYNFTNGEEETVNVLFIGNSYTYYNDMPTEIFAALGASAGLSLNVTAITNGGHTLEKYADPNDTYGAKVEAALSGDTHYDYVILQEQSVRPALEDNAAFYAAVRNLTERVRQKGATPILYATWGRESQSETLTTYGWTNESMTWRLAAAYQAIGEELGIEVAFAGLAFYDVYTSESDINLYNADLSHPSYAGSYLAAATLLAKIFGVDTTALTYTGSLSADDAGVLLTAAYSAASAPPVIPEEYQRSSVGQ